MSEAAGQLVVKNLSKDYPTPGDPLVILHDVSFSMQRGEALAVMGPSGSGKSTLLYILGALEPPTSGTVTLDGANPFTAGEAELASFRNRRVGFVFQDHHLLPQCSALENVLIPTMAPDAAYSGKDAEARARELLDRVGLSGRLEHLPAELSGGERQRVAIARALINQPPLILADEPTGNLDRHTADKVADLLLELHQQENTILVLVTHSLDLAQRLPQRAELLDGKLVPAEGTTPR
ncbi:MAG: ABC transporter ATP-binding protein [Bryobacterales bacterium]